MAEDERISEERKMRTREFEVKTKRVHENTSKAKQNIILRALEETSELEALRREKREILEEERRLRALLSLEKSQANPQSVSSGQNHSQKMRVMASQRIYKQRRYAQKQKKREEYERELEAFRRDESQSLIRKHNVRPRYVSPFFLSLYFSILCHSLIPDPTTPSLPSTTTRTCRRSSGSWKRKSSESKGLARNTSMKVNMMVSMMVSMMKKGRNTKTMTMNTSTKLETIKSFEM